MSSVTTAPPEQEETDLGTGGWSRVWAVVRPHAARRDRVRTDAGHEKGAMLFPELVLARYRRFVMDAAFGEPGGPPARFAPQGWSADSKPPDEQTRKQIEDAYAAKLREFQSVEGPIASAYWCVSMPSGVALTVKKSRWIIPFVWKTEAQIRLHRATDWLTSDEAPVAELLHHCDALAIRASEVLRGPAKRIAMELIYAEETFLLGLLEQKRLSSDSAAKNGRPRSESNGATKWTPPQLVRLVLPLLRGRLRLHEPDHAPADLVEHGRKELIEIEKYYDRAANKAARIMYFWGMMSGIVAAAVIGFGVAIAVDLIFDAVDPARESTRNFFASYAAGAIGAVVSVLMRMKTEDGFTLDYEVGRWQSYRLGTFRPFIGAAFGLAVYFALQSELVQLDAPTDDKAFYFVTLVAFLAGFSERWTKVILGPAERTIAAALGGEERPGPAPRRPVAPRATSPGPRAQRT